MKKRIGILFLAVLLCGNCGNYVSVHGADVEKMELWDGSDEETLQDEGEILEEVPQEETLEEQPEQEEIQDFEVSVRAEEILKAGERAVYEVCLVNTGEVPLNDILLTNVFSCPKVTWEWQPAPGFIVNGQDARLSALLPEQVEYVYVAADLLPEQKGQLTHTITAVSKEGMTVDSSVTSEIQPLRADFAVEKTADCSRAVAGEEVSYQICIRNTGELALHSIITTERFQAEGAKVQFVEKEGIELNKNKDKAFIPLLEPGDSIVLRAVVTLPEEGVKGELVNEVIVLTKETGEKEVVSRVSVQVEEKVYPTFCPEAKTESKEISRVPRTEDMTEPGKKAVALFLSLGMLILMTGVVKGKRKH